MREHACIHVDACVFRRLLDSQRLDGGGLLMYEEAQPLETGLMNIHALNQSQSPCRRQGRGSGSGSGLGSWTGLVGGLVLSRLARCCCTSAFCSDSSAATW